MSAASALVLATGCNSLPGAAALPSGSASTAQAVITGKVYGGQQPISAATLGLYAAGVTGATDGLASTSIFNAGIVVTTSDGSGVANANANAGNSNNTLPAGYFNITSDYTCPSGDPQVFLTASGGNPGISQTTNNAAIQQMLPLGNCSTLSARQSIVINEATTVGMVAALYPYMTGYNDVGSTAAHATAMVTAFNTAAEYVNATNGLAPGPTLPAGYYASTSGLNSLANSVASCVNTASYASGDGGNCDKLFTYATPPSGATPNAGMKPADTVTALLGIRNNPTNNVASIFNLSSAILAFAPALSSAPADWSLPIVAVPATPVVSPYGGTYAATQSVTIADSEASLSLFYTTDGSTPTASSTAYTGAFNVSSTATVNAIAIRASGAVSAVGSTSYTINTALTAPTVSLASLSTTYGSTTALTLTATSNVAGSVVTFGTAGSIGGSFSAATCTISGTTCSVTYTPSATLAGGTYTNDLTANFPASGTFGAGTATGTLTVAATYTYNQTHAFTGATLSGTSITDGKTPYASLVQGSDGSFYGTTQMGGASGYGTVYKMSADGSTYTQLHAFTNATISGTSLKDGQYTYGGLVQGSDGSFYGSTYAGGASGYGTVYKISADGTTYTQLHVFTGATIAGTSLTDGKSPEAVLVQGSDGSFYGSTSAGGAGVYGTVFKISADGSTYTQLHTFNNATISGTSLKDGATPDAGLVQGSDGSFYGTTQGGGAGTYGTVFKISADGSTYTQLHAFTGATISGTSQKDGKYLNWAGVVQGSDGSFYGATSAGGAGGYGTLYKISADGSTYTQMYAFTNATISGTSLKDGNAPYAGLVQGSDGSFYGSTYQGGTSVDGTVFKINADGSTYAQLHAFTGAALSGTSLTDGKGPYTGLMQGSDGSFYGATLYGGSSTYGTVYKIPAFGLLAQVNITVPSSVTHGASFTLGYAVSNAYSITLQRCFATNTGGDTSGWTGVKTAATTTTNATLTAPASAGTYTYTLTCGGMETGLVTLNVQ